MGKFTARFSTVTEKDIKHPIVKRLLKRGWKSFEIVWASKSSSDCGWTIVNTGKGDGKIFGHFLGFTIKEAIQDIEKWNKELFTKN